MAHWGLLCQKQRTYRLFTKYRVSQNDVNTDGYSRKILDISYLKDRIRTVI